MTPVIVISAHTMGLAVIRSLGTQVPTYALTYQPNDMGHVSRFVKKFYSIPHPEKQTDEFLDHLNSIGNILGKAVLIPADDISLSIVSKNKTQLEEMFYIAAPEWETTKQFVVKKHTYQLAEELGIPHSHTFFPEYVEEARAISNHLEYPCIVKPYESHKYFELYFRKMTVVNNRFDLVREVERSFFNNIPVMLQEIIPGAETNNINYNSYRIADQNVQDFYAQKIRISQGSYGVPIVVKSVERVPEIADHTHRLLDKMKFNGFSCTEFKKDERDGTYKLMEVNGRHNRSSLLALKCGINFPLIEYNYLARNYLHRELNYKNNIYWIDEFRDLENFFRRIFKEKYSLKNFLSPYMHKHIFAVSSFSDLSPFIKRLKDSVCILSRRVNKNRKEIKHDIRTGYISSK